MTRPWLAPTTANEHRGPPRALVGEHRDRLIRRTCSAGWDPGCLQIVCVARWGACSSNAFVQWVSLFDDYTDSIMPDLMRFAGILRFNCIWGVVREEECVPKCGAHGRHIEVRPKPSQATGLMFSDDGLPESLSSMPFAGRHQMCVSSILQF